MTASRKKNEAKLPREIEDAFDTEWVKVESQRQLAEEWLATVGEKTSTPPKVFVSWCESNPENSYLVEGLIDPFLTRLGFEVHYYKKDKILGIPDVVISSIMDQCELFVSLYTKEQGESAAGNVIRETGRRVDSSPNAVVLFREHGVNVETMTYPKALCVEFSREKNGTLLLDLLTVLMNNGLVAIRSQK